MDIAEGEIAIEIFSDLLVAIQQETGHPFAVHILRAAAAEGIICVIGDDRAAVLDLGQPVFGIIAIVPAPVADQVAIAVMAEGDLPPQGGPPIKLEFRRMWSPWWTDRSVA